MDNIEFGLITHNRIINLSKFYLNLFNTLSPNLTILISENEYIKINYAN